MLLIIYLLQVRQTENRIPSAILFRFLPVIIFIVFPSNQSVARTDWNRPELSIRGAGQEDRSSGNENVESPKDNAVRTRSGRILRPPKRLDLLCATTERQWILFRKESSLFCLSIFVLFLFVIFLLSSNLRHVFFK